jgi:hypothetical protein
MHCGEFEFSPRAFRDDAVSVLDQNAQGIQGLGCDGDGRSGTQQLAFRGVKTELTKPEHQRTAHVWCPLMRGIWPDRGANYGLQLSTPWELRPV